MKLFLVLMGGRPPQRHTEQHDVFFGIGEKMSDLVPRMLKFWPEAKQNLHVDAWRTITGVDGFQIDVRERQEPESAAAGLKLFFLNLGGYKPGLLDELHFKFICVAENKGQAIQSAKKTMFYHEAGFPGAESHIDDRFALDVDDLYEIKDILPADQKEKYRIDIYPAADFPKDELHLGYFKLASL